MNYFIVTIKIKKFAEKPDFVFFFFFNDRRKEGTPSRILCFYYIIYYIYIRGRFNDLRSCLTFRGTLKRITLDLFIQASYYILYLVFIPFALVLVFFLQLFYLLSASFFFIL